MIVYISIGNSDDKLSQEHWARFIERVDEVVDGVYATVHGRWYSSPRSPFQNACWCVEFVVDAVATVRRVRRALRQLASDYQQDCIAWAVAETEFLTPDPV